MTNAKIAFAQGSRDMANNLNDLYERWLLRKEESSRSIQMIIPNLKRYDIPDTIEEAIDMRAELVAEKLDRDVLVRSRSVFYKDGRQLSSRDHDTYCSIIRNQQSYIDKTLAYINKRYNARRVTRGRVRRANKKLEASNALGGISQEDFSSAIHGLWIMAKKLHTEGRVTYSVEEWDIIDKCRSDALDTLGIFDDS